MGTAPRVVVVSGHLVDSPDRPAARFPPSEVPRVAAAIGQVLGEWRVGPATTVVTGGARGADILGAEAALARGARVRLVLAKPADEFEQESVALAGGDWVARFRALLDVADVEVVEPGPDDAFERANARMIELVEAAGPDRRALLVWDGRPGDGPGGTSDIAHRLGLDPTDERVRVIDPRPLGADPPESSS